MSDQGSRNLTCITRRRRPSKRVALPLQNSRSREETAPLLLLGWSALVGVAHALARLCAQEAFRATAFQSDGKNPPEAAPDNDRG